MKIAWAEFCTTRVSRIAARTASGLMEANLLQSQDKTDDEGQGKACGEMETLVSRDTGIHSAPKATVKSTNNYLEIFTSVSVIFALDPRHNKGRKRNALTGPKLCVRKHTAV